MGVTGHSGPAKETHTEMGAEEKRMQYLSRPTVLCSVIFSLLLLTCLQLPVTSPPSSLQSLQETGCAGNTQCGWQVQASACTGAERSLLSSDIPLLSLLSCLSGMETSEAELTHPVLCPYGQGVTSLISLNLTLNSEWQPRAEQRQP